MSAEAINLSWQVQIVLVAGYLGYSVAYSGRRAQHKTLDSTAITLCFGAIALLALNVSLRSLPAGFEYRNILSAGLAILISLASGSLWRAKLRGLSQWLLEKINAEQDDGHQTAWQTITQEPGLAYSQVLVTLKNGNCLESYQMEPFNSLPNGSVVFGIDGSVALYVNAIIEDGDRREIDTISDEDGHRITYVPADQIAEVDLRRAPKI